jgi:hypothetical protein
VGKKDRSRQLEGLLGIPQEVMGSRSRRALAAKDQIPIGLKRQD